MKPYQAIARAFRPQQFSQVLQQEAIVKTLVNAITQDRVAHAYLFSGGRGSGKTTLARLFAKALNCSQRQIDCEPCNTCPSCKEIASGVSLDLIEIDGASARGIDDIRQINETIGYSPGLGHYRIYLIDEVHMLTKEAFNALLKTLEEPPPQAKFFFATTEPHKIPDTIKSRCQHFPLKRISEDNIIKKLTAIAANLGFTVEEAVFHLIAARAEGSLRDAEGLLDQLLTSTEETLTSEKVALFLGIAPQTIFDELDKAFAADDLSFAFTAVQKLSDGDFSAIFDQLIHHFRKTLQKALKKEATPYSIRQALAILEYLIKAKEHLKTAISLSLKLEAAFLFIIGEHKKCSLDELIERLELLEKRLSSQRPQAPALVKEEPLKQQNFMDVAKLASKEDVKILPKATGEVPAGLSPIKAEAKPQIKSETSPSHDKHHVETLLQFAAVELEGTLKRH